ncbi:MAG: TatD family hydrolase [Verrucomicrobiota bacterium]
MALHFHDAHNHLQDERLRPARAEILAALRREGIARMVVNGSCEEDWPEVMSLARSCPEVIPSFGYHPWYVRERSPEWQGRLLQFLDAVPSAVGEIGLDRWIKDHDLAEQEEVFVWQLRTAAERQLPVSIHCLQAWGRMLEILEREPRPRCGFVLHSYGGPAEMVEPLAKLGAYFSLPGCFALERKVRQRDAFKRVPPDRLLIETDAPDQNLPAERVAYPLTDQSTQKPINHPANLPAVYRFAAELRNTSLEALTDQVGQNFQRLFRLPCLPRPATE